VKICDFGLARHKSSSLTLSDTRGPTNTATYTPEYTSPQRMKDPRKRCFQDDVFGFGMLLYFIATSESPMAGIDSSEVRDLVKEGYRPPIDEWLVNQALVDGDKCGVIAAKYCQLAKDCWHASESDRPTLQVVCDRLLEMVKEWGDH
jgi:serine/threonine protein kinase